LVVEKAQIEMVHPVWNSCRVNIQLAKLLIISALIK